MEINKRQSIKSSKKKISDETDEENLLGDVQRLIDYLFEQRLIEKIVRPVDKRTREEQIERYALKMEQLHLKLKKIRDQVIEMTSSENGNARGKSVFGEATNKPDDWKKIIRSIETKYTQVFTDGSFKHFPKISHALTLNCSHSMELINIEQWAAACLDTHSHDLCC